MSELKLAGYSSSVHVLVRVCVYTCVNAFVRVCVCEYVRECELVWVCT